VGWSPVDLLVDTQMVEAPSPSLLCSSYRGQLPNQSPVLAAAVATEQPSHRTLRRVEQEYSLAAELNAASGHQLALELSKPCCWSSSAVRRKHNRNAILDISSGATRRLVPKRHDSDVAVYEVKMRLKIFANQIRTSSRHYKLLVRRPRTGVS